MTIAQHPIQERGKSKTARHQLPEKFAFSSNPPCRPPGWMKAAYIGPYRFLDTPKRKNSGQQGHQPSHHTHSHSPHNANTRSRSAESFRRSPPNSQRLKRPPLSARAPRDVEPQRDNHPPPHQHPSQQPPNQPSQLENHNDDRGHFRNTVHHSLLRRPNPTPPPPTAPPKPPTVPRIKGLKPDLHAPSSRTSTPRTPPSTDVSARAVRPLRNEGRRGGTPRDASPGPTAITTPTKRVVLGDTTPRSPEHPAPTPLTPKKSVQPPLHQPFMFTLPAMFGHGGAQQQELLMMVQCLWAARGRIFRHIISLPDDRDKAEWGAVLDKVLEMYTKATRPEHLLPAADSIKHLLSFYNTTHRLKGKASLAKFSHTSLPINPPTPSEYVHEKHAWSAFGAHSADWVGHGYWWRPAPADQHTIENAAGNAMNDYDLLEDGFYRIKGAKLLMADYQQIKADFPKLQECSNTEIDQWLLDNCAYISEGQVCRMREGGDHCDRLGISDVWDFVDETSRAAGIRQKSGGRAATFLVDRRYSFDAKGTISMATLDVKGIGTHKSADISDPKVTGLLSLGDALREIAMERLLNHLATKEGATWKTTRCLALIDTGLRYNGVNPATGVENERCVLLVRQRNSRHFADYEHFSFSGVMPSQVLSDEMGSAIRRTLLKYGVSAEFVPRSLFHPSLEAALADLSGQWNLQADAPCRHLVDFSDYYVLPTSPLPSWWKMSKRAVIDAFSLERSAFTSMLVKCPSLMDSLLGTTDRESVNAQLVKRRKELSKKEHCTRAAAKVDAVKGILPGKPQYCMCWFMELDDSEMAKWIAKQSSQEDLTSLVSFLEMVDSHLPN